MNNYVDNSRDQEARCRAHPYVDGTGPEWTRGNGSREASQPVVDAVWPAAFNVAFVDDAAQRYAKEIAA